MKRLIAPIASRSYVYGAGFLQIYLISRALSPNEFGQFSYVQSIVEIALVIATLGGGIILTKAATQSAARQLIAVWPVLAMGTPMALAAAIFLLHGKSLDSLAMLSIIVSIVAQSWLQTRIYQLRGFGKSLFFIYEPALRATVVSLLVLLGALTFKFNVSAALMCIAAASIFSCLLAQGVTARFCVPGRQKVKIVADTVAMFPASIIGFIGKKSDLIILASVQSFSFVGSFKISFLFAEIGYQMVQAVLVNRTRLISEAATDKAKRKEILKRALIDSIIISSSVGTGIYAFLLVCGHLIFPNHELVPMLPGLIVYFIFKSISSIFENLLIFAAQYRVVLLCLAASGLAKLILIPLWAKLLGGGMIYLNLAYIIIGLIEVAFWVKFSRKKFNEN